MELFLSTHFLLSTGQFLKGTRHEFSELILARVALLMDQSRSIPPLRSAKAREFGELWREKCTPAPQTFSAFFLVAQTLVVSLISAKRK